MDLQALAANITEQLTAIAEEKRQHEARLQRVVAQLNEEGHTLMMREAALKGQLDLIARLQQEGA